MDLRRSVLAKVMLLALAILAGYASHLMLHPADLAVPAEVRQSQPASPATVEVYNRTFNLATLENPLRLQVLELMRSDDQAAWQSYDEMVAEGRELYYQNCFYCHGDLLDGKGHYAAGLNPSPTNFQDPQTIAQLREADLFWRITTGGAGLPEQGAPWNSSMPAWEEELEEDQVWQLILFLYDYVGQLPRLNDPQHAASATVIRDQIQARRENLSGKELYMFRCAMCHGEEGMGDGPAAKFLYPRPQDFSMVQFKYKFSPSTLPPLDDDLFLVIKFGLAGTSMPGFRDWLSDRQIQSLIPVIKGFDVMGMWVPADAEDEDFDDQDRYIGTDFRRITEREPLTGKVAFSDASVAKGKALYKKFCAECHGEEGRGNLTTDKRLKDDWGRRIWPRDLTQPWTWRATHIPGPPAYVRSTIIDKIYSRLTIGISGTPMPANRAGKGDMFKDPIAQEDRWHLANYVYTLRDNSVPPTREGLIRAQEISGPLPDTVDAMPWTEAPAVSLRLVPNIIRGERLFTPLNDNIMVRALYNETEIAFLLELNDRTDSRPGDPISSHIHDQRLPMHADAFAIQFPKEDGADGAAWTKPQLAHGDHAHSAIQWYWNAGSMVPPKPAQARVFEVGGLSRPMARQQADNGLTATGRWERGRWRVLMKSPRYPQSTDVHFDEGAYIPVAFANWDGNNGEIGSRHTLTSWHWLVLQPQANPLRSYGLPVAIGLGIFLLGLLVLRRLRPYPSAV